MVKDSGASKEKKSTYNKTVIHHQNLRLCSFQEFYRVLYLFKKQLKMEKETS